MSFPPYDPYRPYSPYSHQAGSDSTQQPSLSGGYGNGVTDSRSGARKSKGRFKESTTKHAPMHSGPMHSDPMDSDSIPAHSEGDGLSQPVGVYDPSLQAPYNGQTIGFQTAGNGHDLFGYSPYSYGSPQGVYGTNEPYGLDSGSVTPGMDTHPPTSKSSSSRNKKGLKGGSTRNFYGDFSSTKKLSPGHPNFGSAERYR
ncbi:hypothetical protein GQ53DRAFT_431125 [Thozetella sp. PMI_491]|nr:hypothetical protein GQ53DRAFT_431125 [Thozetella sp. PMI_491]